MSNLEKYDTNGNGKIDPHELELIEIEDRRRQMDDSDKQRDQIRIMVWFALAGMLLYPSLIVFTDLINLTTATVILGDISPTYFVSVSALVASFFGASAYQAKKAK